MAKIIVLDDQQVICESLKIRLTRDGHEVRTAVDGADAIDMGYLFEPDLLITDWDLESDYNGVEVAEAVTVANKAIKKILITGHRNDRRLDDSGFLARFYKPFSIDQLASFVNELVEPKRPLENFSPAGTT